MSLFAADEPEVYAKVAVPVPLGRAFSYLVPSALRSLVTPGVRVLCEFGRRKLLGVVLEVSNEPPRGIEASKLKPLLSVFDEQPVLTPDLLRFLEELAAYYLAPIGEVLRLALPSLERSQLERVRGEHTALDAKLSAVGRLVQVAVAREGKAPEGLRGQAAQVFEQLTRGECPVSELEKQFSNARGAVKRLVELDLVTIEKRTQSRDPFFAEAVERDEPETLNAAQQVAVDVIVGAVQAERQQAFLLHGVTGSGKTEVYLHAVAACLELGKGAMVLVPEIALTPQLVARFRARFGDRIAVLHSALSELDRHAMWKRLRSGELRVAVGARSALFAPVVRLALVCVDEEHDASFKQEEGVRYHARDMALLRAYRAGCVCVLGSATPSLASEALVRRNKLTRLSLPERARRDAVLPRVEVVDLRRFGPGPTGHRLLSLPLHRAVEATLEAKQQVILFLNRRGFAPSIVCEVCGEVQRCPNCSVALTVHRSGVERMRCHYCEYTARVADECSECHARALTHEGAGTERIESVLKDAFPSANVARLDRDVAEGLKSEAILAKMRSGEVDILVGTQMVTKGHDLANVTLVGVLNADAALSLPDFQAAERTFHLLVQVAGRAGRGERPGRVLIQTRNPEHPAVRFAVLHDTHAFVERELRERREAQYPPFARLLMVRVDSLSNELARATVERLAELSRARLGRTGELLGPSPAPLERLRNRYRHRFLVRAAERAPLYRVAHLLIAQKVDRRVRVSVDIDPVSML